MNKDEIERIIEIEGRVRDIEEDRADWNNLLKFLGFIAGVVILMFLGFVFGYSMAGGFN